MNYSKDAILDRARGAILGTAVADALGAGYEFLPPVPDTEEIVFRKRLFELGEYTDDTAQLVAICLASSKGDIATNLDLVAKEFYEWYLSNPNDVGRQTHAVFKASKNDQTAKSLIATSTRYIDEVELAAGNGSLMRTASVALPYLSDPEKIAQVANDVSSLTHMDLDCREACVIWSKAIRHAILFENFDGIQLAINDLPAFRQVYWNQVFDEADQAERPSDFERNGWVISCIKAAYKAITMTNTDSPEDLVNGITAAVRCGWDTDTVAAVAGALLGARWGYSAIPRSWLEVIHGWPGYREADLVALADQITEPIWQ